jgi:Glycosyl transferase family 2
VTGIDLGRLLARHWPLAALLAAGLLVRLTSDAGLGGTALVGLATALAAYVVGVRWGCWRWLAGLAIVPALLDDRMLHDQALRPSAGLLAASASLLCLSYPALRAPLAQAAPVAVVWLAGLVVPLGADVVAGDPATWHVHDPRVLTSLLALPGLLAALGAGRSGPVVLRLACAAALVTGASSPLAEVTWWPVAGALGITAMLRGRRGRGSTSPQQDAIDEAALAEFHRRHRKVRLGPVAIVIAAYNEADGIPGVLQTLPEEVCGLHADVVVVDDGSTDCTASALEHSRAYVVSCPANRGQGAALRLGYRVAREHGAAYILTTDADGQYAVADMPVVLEPILEDRADFVTGSRILGHQQTRDRVRRTGVHVFAWLATLLTGHRFTDTSFGLRAMRAEVSRDVTLNQRQYQSSELLLGAVSHGYRVLEVPGSMNLRSAGATKKGTNLVYGSHYARAMTGTWLREGLPRPVSETAAALRHTGGHGD